MPVFVVFFFLHGPQQRRIGVARYLIVAGLPAESVQMPREVISAAVQPERALAGVRVVRPAKIQPSAQAFRRRLRNTPGAGINHSADRP